jgi:hypothetical protein
MYLGAGAGRKRPLAAIGQRSKHACGWGRSKRRCAPRGWSPEVEAHLRSMARALGVDVRVRSWSAKQDEHAERKKQSLHTVLLGSASAMLRGGDDEQKQALVSSVVGLGFGRSYTAYRAACFEIAGTSTRQASGRACKRWSLHPSCMELFPFVPLPCMLLLGYT